MWLKNICLTTKHSEGISQTKMQQFQLNFTTVPSNNAKQVNVILEN